MINVVTNRQICIGDFYSRIEEIAKARPERIILREKDLGRDEYLKCFTRCLSICEKYSVKLSVNSFDDLAYRLRYPYINVSFNKFRSDSSLPSKFNEIGVSVHSIDEAGYASEKRATYIIAGHIFNTKCKENLAPKGLAYFQNICRESNIPVYAIGGINGDNIGEVLKCGAAGVCIMSGLMTCAKPYEYICEIKDKLI